MGLGGSTITALPNRRGWQEELSHCLAKCGERKTHLTVAVLDLDAGTFDISVDEYLKRYYVGHYSPFGNMFCAFAIKDKLVEMLEPKPRAYPEK